MRLSVSLAVALTVSVWAFPVQAAPSITAEGALKAKADVEKTLSYHTEMAKILGQGIVIPNGVQAEPLNDHYLITLKDIAATYESGGKIDIGTITMEMTPQDDGGYATTVHLPATVTFIDPLAKPIAEIKIGQQSLNGTWYPDVEMFTKLDADLGNVVFKNAGDAQPFEVKVANVQTKINFTKNSDNTWSGPSLFSASGISVSDPSSPESHIAIARMAGEGTYERLNLDAARQIREKTLAFMKGGTQKRSPDEIRAFIASIMEQNSHYMNGLTSSFTVEGVDIDMKARNTPATATTPAIKSDPVKLTIAKGSGKVNIGGLQEKTGNFLLKLNVEGMDAPSAPADLIAVIPSDTGLQISLDKLPIAAISDAFSGLMSDAMTASYTAEEQQGQPDANAQAAKKQAELQQKAMAAMAALPKMLVDAGSTLSISDTYVKTKDVRSSLDGSFKASMVSPIMTEGGATLSIKGLDEFVNKLQRETADPKADPRIGGVAQILVFIQLTGQLGKDADGTSLRTYKFDLTPEGKMMINGVDASTLTGGLLAPKGGRKLK